MGANEPLKAPRMAIKFGAAKPKASQPPPPLAQPRTNAFRKRPALGGDSDSEEGSSSECTGDVVITGFDNQGGGGGSTKKAGRAQEISEYGGRDHKVIPLENATTSLLKRKRKKTTDSGSLFAVEKDTTTADNSTVGKKWGLQVTKKTEVVQSEQLGTTKTSGTREESSKPRTIDDEALARLTLEGKNPSSRQVIAQVNDVEKGRFRSDFHSVPVSVLASISIPVFPPHSFPPPLVIKLAQSHSPMTLFLFSSIVPGAEILLSRQSLRS